MEWKKQNKEQNSKKLTRTKMKKTSSVLDKCTRRRKQSKHKKILTEGVNYYPDSHATTQQQTRKLLGNSISEAGKTFVEKSVSQFSKSYHSSSSSLLAKEFDWIGQAFQAENQRIRQVLRGLPDRLTGNVGGYGEHKESLAEKIKKQNILVKSSFAVKPLR